MSSTFLGLEIGKKSLLSHSQALYTTGHNLSNASTEGYSRQRINFSAAEPLYIPGIGRAETVGQIGQGASISLIQRVRDNFIDQRIITEKSQLGYWRSRHDYLTQIEMIHNEPGEKNIRGLMDEYWVSLENLANYPEQKAARQEVRERAETLSASIRHTFNRFAEMRTMVNDTVKAKVDEINNIAQDISILNNRIQKSLAVGDQPNDLMDKRDMLIERLSEITDVSTGRSNNGEFIVYIGGENLVQGDIYEPLILERNNLDDGMYRVVWSIKGHKPKFKSGEIKGLIDIRDIDLVKQMREIDSLAINFTDLVNEIHRDGFGLTEETNINFFREQALSTDNSGNFDFNNDGMDEASVIFKIAGNTRLNPDTPIGSAGTLSFVDNSGNPVNINYIATDSIASLIKKINLSNAQVSAYLNHNGNLSIKARANDINNRESFIIKTVQDSGTFLSATAGILNPGASIDWKQLNQTGNIQGSYTLTPIIHFARVMDLSDNIKNNINLIAASKGTDYTGNNDPDTINGVGDGSNALEIAKLRYKKAMIDSNSTFNEYYTALVAGLGTTARKADDLRGQEELLIKNLDNLRESVSGVNLDEEMTNMLKFQQGYTAAARIVTEIDKMLGTLMRMGA